MQVRHGQAGSRERSQQDTRRTPPLHGAVDLLILAARRALLSTFHLFSISLSSGLDFPDSKVVKIGEVTVGLLHGHQVVPWGDPAMLANQARSMAVDILVSGHTHAAEVLCAEGSTSAPAAKSSGATGSTLFLNPGSITGAYSPFTTNVMPSFLLLAIQGGNVTVYQYEIGAEQQVVVTKIEWKKQ